MIDTAGHRDICQQLRHLLDAGTLVDEPRKTGERVLRRLSSDIRVVLLGPGTEGKDYLQEVLTARALPRTKVRLVAWGDDVNFQDADICLWVTSWFEHAEAEQWQSAPDRLKDHSFLVPTADTDTAVARFGRARLSALGDIAAEEFYGLFPIVTRVGATDPQRDRIEGLVREVANMVRLGLQADADNAQMFLRLHQGKEVEPPQPAVSPLHPSTRDGPETRDAVTEVYRTALDALRHHTEALAPLVTASEDTDVLRILSICQETSAAVADVFSGSALRDPDFVEIREDMLSAADRILLMSLEGGVAPAVAAVTTLLQIRREMEVQIAC